MSEIQNLIVNKLEKVETDISDIKVAVTENTTDLKHHIKRTDDLQSIVEDLNIIINPIHQDFISKKAIEEYKKKQKEELLYRLKLPSYIAGAIVAIGTIIAWFMRK